LKFDVSSPTRVGVGRKRRYGTEGAKVNRPWCDEVSETTQWHRRCQG